MRKQFLFTVSLILTLFFSSCNKDLTALDPGLFKCTPNPLEEKGGVVNATITGKFPEKYFAKNATVTVTPVLKFKGQEVKGQTAVFQGEKVVGNVEFWKTLENNLQGLAFIMGNARGDQI